MHLLQLLSFISMHHPAISALSSLAKEAVFISVKLHSPCGFDEVSATVEEFSELLFLRGAERKGCLPVK